MTSHDDLTPEMVLAAYRPQRISDATWDRIRPHAHAAISRCDGLAGRMVRQYLTKVCGLLAWADGQGLELDDPSLFSDETVERYLAQAGFADGTLPPVRSMLRRMAPDGSHADRTLIDRYRPRGIDPQVWVTVAPAVRAAVRRCLPLSDSATTGYLGYAARYVTWAHHQGVELTGDELFTDELLDRYAASELDKVAGTYRVAIRSALDQMRTSPTIRQLGQHHPDRIAHMLATFQPTSVPDDIWTSIRDLAIEAVTATDPQSCDVVRQLLGGGGNFLAWCHLQPGLPVKPERVFTEPVIARYVHDALSGRPEAVQATLRSQVRRLARAHPDGPMPPAPCGLRAQNVLPPYNSTEIDGFLAAADTQRTLLRRRKFSAILTLGLGGGLLPGQMRMLTGRDIERDEQGVCLAHLTDVGRTVVITERYADRLLAAADEAGDHLLVGGYKTDRSHGVADIIATFQFGTDLPDFEARRLRSTWMVAQLTAGVRLDVLLGQCGLTSTRSIDDYLQFVEPVDVHVGRHQLRHADGGEVVA